MAVGVFVVGYYVVLTQWYSEEMIVVARLLLCMAMLILAMVSSGGILDNRIMTFFGGISLELYLSHMFIFRIAEKMGLLYVFGDGWLQFLVTTVIVVAALVMLGFQQQASQKTVDKIVKDDPQLEVAKIIKKALSMI